jgi:tripartite-type tricarboxylate transporter receptor subunit TctC
MKSIRLWIHVACLLVLSFAQGSSIAQPDYPNRPIRIIVPFAAGSAADTVGRAIAEELAKVIGAPVVVENREGAGGNIGNAAAAKASPDGYTLLMGTSLMTMSVHTTVPPAYDVVKDFVPIARVGSIPLVAVASSNAKFKTWSELVGYAKANAGKINYATSGKGSASHVYAEMLKREFGFDAQDVSYKNVNQAVIDTSTGAPDFFIANLPPTRALMQAGQLRALAVGSRQRLGTLPDIPTFAELTNRPDLEMALWYGFFAPTGTPPAIISRLPRDILKATDTPTVRARLEVNGGVLALGSAAELETMVKTDNVRFRNLMMELGLVATGRN